MLKFRNILLMKLPLIKKNPCFLFYFKMRHDILSALLKSIFSASDFRGAFGTLVLLDSHWHAPFPFLASSAFLSAQQHF